MVRCYLKSRVCTWKSTNFTVALTGEFSTVWWRFNGAGTSCRHSTDSRSKSWGSNLQGPLHREADHSHLWSVDKQDLTAAWDSASFKGESLKTIEFHLTLKKTILCRNNLVNCFIDLKFVTLSTLKLKFCESVSNK